MKKMTALAMALIMSASAASGIAAHAEEAQYASQINGYSKCYTCIQTDSYTTYTYSYSSDGSESSYSITFSNNSGTPSSDPYTFYKQSSEPAASGTQSSESAASGTTGSTPAATATNAVIDNKTLKLTQSSKLFNASETRPWYFYHLSDYGISGVGKTGDTFHNAGYGKLVASITDGRNLKATFKSFDGSVRCSNITLKNSSGSSEQFRYSNDEHSLTADLYDLSTGSSLYEICAPCETAAGSCDLKLYLYADDSAGTGRKYYICYGEQHYATEAFSPMSRKNSTDSLLKKENVTPDSARNASRNYTGVCLDFSSIYAIMCREQGIPCVVLNNNKHAWNAVYLNNEWVEIDLTQDVNRCVYNKDTTDVQGTSLYCYTGFANYAVNTDTAITATSFCY